MDAIQRTGITPEYIRGWADRQSQVNVSGRSITVTMSNEQPGRSIYAALIRLNIEGTFQRLQDDRWELRVGKKEALEKWRDLIGFTCPDKRERLDTILQSYS